MSRFTFIFANKAGHLMGSLRLIQSMMCNLTVRSCSTSVPQSSVKDNPVVTVQQGQLRGTIAKLVDGSTYYSFKGVPYAQPPVGKLRFKAPLPPQPWKGIYEAAEHGNMCPQFDMNTKMIEEGDENCLFLNIYTKTLNPTNAPVMVYIHGGAFMSGSGNSDLYGPDFLLQHDVILVSINYRLEVLGFLCLDTPEVPGNAGLKDQVAALRWVKNNIGLFGGDPNNITIIGESAGAACVAYHMLSSMSKGLFNKAIAQSGTCIDDWSIQKDARARAFKIGKVLGKNTEDPNELLEFLQGLPATELAALTFKIRTGDEKHRGLPIYFNPVVEKRFDRVDAFITEEPLDLLLAERVNKVPLIMGYNVAEGFLTLTEQLKKIDFKNKNLHYYVPRELALKLPEAKMIEFGERIRRFYVGERKFSEDTAEALIDMQTDIHFCYNVHRFLHFYAAVTQAVYAYRFNYVTDLNFIRNTREEDSDGVGACHADDLFYFFCNNVNMDSYQEQDTLKHIVWKVTKLWTNFAKTGNPTPDDTIGVKWDQYNNNTKSFLTLQEPLSNGPSMEKERVAFWNKLYSEAGVPHIRKSNL